MTPDPACPECGGTGVEHLLSANVLCGVCMPKSPDDSDATPVEPAIRRSSSGQLRPGLAVCPVCNGARIVDGSKCFECGGGGRVTLKRHGELVGLHSYDDLPDTLSADSSNPPPPTERKP